MWCYSYSVLTVRCRTRTSCISSGTKMSWAQRLALLIAGRLNRVSHNLFQENQTIQKYIAGQIILQGTKLPGEYLSHLLYTRAIFEMSQQIRQLPCVFVWNRNMSREREQKEIWWCVNTDFHLMNLNTDILPI